jgi:peptidylprolyl isomerase
MIRITALWAFLLLVSSCSSTPQGNPVAVKSVLENGLMIEDLVVGRGEPADSLTFVTLHYTGYLADSTLFEARADDKTPLTIQLTRQNVIEGWFWGIQGMRKGGIRSLTVPPQLAYGSMGIAGIIPKDATLRFVIELHETKRPPEAWKIDNAALESTADGSRHVVLESGRGKLPKKGDILKLHYSGYLSDGRIFDSSVYRGDALRVVAGNGSLIPGWESTLMRMKAGERRSVFIPPHLSFGKGGLDGRIPPNDTLRFDIELLSVKTP